MESIIMGFEILGVILYWILCGIGIFLLAFIAFLMVVWLLVPTIIRYKHAPDFDASYEPKFDKVTNTIGNKIKDQITTNSDLPPQNCIPEVNVNEKTGSIRIQFGEERVLEDFCVKIYWNNTWYSSFQEVKADTADIADPTDPTINPSKNNHTNNINSKLIRLLSCKKTANVTTNLGFATVYTFMWEFETNQLSTSVIVYPNSNYIIFNTAILNDTTQLKTGVFEQANVIFPCFLNRSPNQRIVTFYQDCFCVPRRDFKVIFGPVCLFDDQKNTIIMSALDNVITNCIEKEELTEAGILPMQRFSFGVNGQVDVLPKYYTHSFIMIFHHGINESYRLWGSLLRKYNGCIHDKEENLDGSNNARTKLYPDIVNSHLGYFTDNGADYYYRTIRGMKADATLIEVKKHAENLGIPYQYYQLDSWWYQKMVKKGKHQWLIHLIGTFFGGYLWGGATLWEPDKKYFDMELPELSKQLGNKPFIAHGRWYLEESPYVKKYKFNIEGGWAMPDDPAFWDHIMNYCKENHIAVYEQDWMVTQLRHFWYLRSQPGRAEEWLRNMAQSAGKYGLTIQYCMEIPSMLMFAVNLPQVTHVRSSNDYNARWPHMYDIPFFTQSAMLADALGIRPFKDVFKSTRRGRINGERCPELECLISALSTGPVAPGDRIGYMNKPLLDAACRPDGLLLKPDRAITAADLCYIKNSTYYICSTESKHGDHVWHYVLTANFWPNRVKTPHYTLKEIDITSPTGKFVEYDWFGKKSRVVTDSEPLSFRLKYEQYSYRTYSPLVADTYALMGNLSKFATMNFKQFTGVFVRENGVEWNLTGIAYEMIEISVFATKLPSRITFDTQQIELGGKPMEGKGIELSSWMTASYNQSEHILRIRCTFNEAKTIHMNIV